MCLISVSMIFFLYLRSCVLRKLKLAQHWRTRWKLFLYVFFLPSFVAFSALARRSLRFSSLFSLFTGDWWFSFHIFLSSSTTRSTFSRKSFFPLFLRYISNDLRCFSGEIALHTLSDVLENSTRIFHLSWYYSDLNSNLTDDQKSLSVDIRFAKHFKEIRKNLEFFSPKNFHEFNTRLLENFHSLFTPLSCALEK